VGRTATKYDKVVARELCSVQSRGTKRYSFLDGDSGDTGSAHLLAIKEASSDGLSSFGICFIDTSVGIFHVGFILMLQWYNTYPDLLRLANLSMIGTYHV
jgi:DNA mismatch repair ATPase MutS